MEEIIEQIWNDAEKLGWEAIKGKKESYKELYRQFTILLIESAITEKKIKEIDVVDEIITGESAEKTIYQCIDCGKSFRERQQLYDHFKICHKTKISL